MNNYYSDKLSAERLRLCYEIAPPRVKQYLDTEIEFVVDKLNSSDHILELGCGYGRVLKRLAPKANSVTGIDTSHKSLLLAQKMMKDSPNCRLLEMNAVCLGFRDGTFDLTVCIQNGISAFHVDQQILIGEAIRVTRKEGKVLFSSYSQKFWQYRLEWFEIQAQHGLIGEIDYEATGNGIIVGKDGFRATTVNPVEFTTLTSHFGIIPTITEIDNSSIFCEITVK